MKNSSFKTFTILAFLIILSFQSFGQSPTNENHSEFSIEIDPATFLFKGYSIHLRFKPKNSQHLIFGIGAYAMDFPSQLVDLNAKNKNEGWDVRLNQGFGLFGEYHFSEPNKKWFLGTQIGIQEYKIENENLSGNEHFTNSLFMGYGGYTWRVFNDKFYIKPWAGIGYTSKISGNNSLENLEYDIAPITMFATLHIGYTF